MIAVNRATGVVLDEVRYSYPRESRLALNRVSWQIPAGEFVVVTGPSGSGKSTMLRCLNGLVPHFSGGKFGGRAEVFGFDTRNFGPRHLSSHVGFVFQDPEAQAVARIVEDDIAFGLEQAGLPRFEMRKRVEEVLDLLGIAPLRSRDITTLSGGERQRVAIAGVLARRPDLLVLDEPTSQLDPWGADEVLTALHRLNDDLGLAVVLAEHRLDRVASSADTIRIVNADGTIVDRPAREALSLLPALNQPPLTRFAHRAGWARIPLTIKEGRRQLSRSDTSPQFDAHLDVTGRTVASIDRVSIHRRETCILDDVSIDFRAGQITAIMGRNGSGKTTLLRGMLGMLPLASGRISIEGRSIEYGQTSALAGVVGYLPQDPARLLFAESVVQEIDATVRRLPIDRQPRDIADLLSELDLTQLAHRHPRDLSAGERERAALAAVLVGSPSLLILDEPTRGMDGVRKNALMKMLNRERERGRAIVLATHDVELVAEWADRVVLLGNREITADGHPRQVLADSVTFSPQMNRLFGGNMLTVDDALEYLRGEHSAIP